MALLKALRRSRTLLFATGAAVCVAAAAGIGAAQPLEERLQVCGTCHGETGNSTMENVPSLAGQPALFLTNQLILMSGQGELSQASVQVFSEPDMLAVARRHRENVLTERQRRRAEKAREIGISVDEIDDHLWRIWGLD